VVRLRSSKEVIVVELVYSSIRRAVRYLVTPREIRVQLTIYQLRVKVFNSFQHPKTKINYSVVGEPVNTDNQNYSSRLVYGCTQACEMVQFHLSRSAVGCC